MEKLIVFLTIQLLVIIPLIAVALNRYDYKWKYLLLLALYYFLYTSLLSVPNWFPELRIIDLAYWNWSGKIYAITGSLVFYFQFRKLFTTHNYITLKRKNNSINIILVITIVVFLGAIAWTFFSIKKSDERFEMFLFQFTMPGLDEELAYRGIILGLLSNSLKPKIHIGPVNLGNPALLITSILFGLSHSIHIDNNWSFHHNWFEFVNVFAVGLFLGWITIKSGNILMSILMHNLINTLPNMLLMI